MVFRVWRCLMILCFIGHAFELYREVVREADYDTVLVNFSNI